MSSALGRLVAGAGLCLLAGLSSAQLSVAPINGTTITPTSLAQSLLGANSGISITSSTYTGVNAATGTFASGFGAIGIDSGVLLTSGAVVNVLGPNDDNAAGTPTNEPGDIDLDALVTGSSTFDASVLTITFVPTGSTIQFSYVFGSEEYNEYVDSTYNDVFGFFVNGVNRALILGTSTPVSINNINCGYSDSGTPPPGPGKNCNLYVNNDPATLGTQLDGLTKVLTFTAPVNPNVQNTLKIAIADTSDRVLDSAVFIAGGTLAVVTPPTITKAFGTSSIALNGSTSVTFTVTNPNAVAALSGIAFTDTLPAGLVVSTPNGLTGTCGGGTITAVAGSGTISLSGATLAAGLSCTFGVNVTGTTAGTKSNVTSAVTSTEGGTGESASANLLVGVPAVTINDVSQTEGNSGTTAFNFTVTIAASANATVSFATADGTATAGSDYVAASGTVTFTAGGPTTQTVTVLVNGDTLVEGSEAFFVNLSNASGATIADAQGVGTIVDDDAPAPISIPTLGEWQLLLLASLLGAFAVQGIRRRG